MNNLNSLLIEAYPFAFDGPCASLSGPGILVNLLRNKHMKDRIPLIKIYNQQFDESPSDYLGKIFFRLMTTNIRKRICLV